MRALEVDCAFEHTERNPFRSPGPTPSETSVGVNSVDRPRTFGGFVRATDVSASGASVAPLDELVSLGMVSLEIVPLEFDGAAPASSDAVHAVVTTAIATSNPHTATETRSRSGAPAPAAEIV